MKVLGLDRFAPDGIPRPEGDGQFDFRPGMTVYQDEGESIFPYVRPFDTGIRHYFVEHGLPVPDSAFFSPEVYDSARVVAQQSAKNRYLMRGCAIVN